jgi:hypothetical protein
LLICILAFPKRVLPIRKDGMKTTFRPERICCFVLLLAAPALAQNGLQSPPATAVTGPSYDVSAGYTNLMMAIPGAQRVSLNGLDASGSLGLSSHWAAILESSFARTSNVLSTGHQAYMSNTQSGTVFYPWEHRNTRFLLRGLAGIAVIDGAVPIDRANYFHGWLGRPSFTCGGGVEHAITDQFMLRVNADYLRTSFYDAAGAVQGQNNLRLSMSFVFRLKSRHYRPGPEVQ